MGEGPGGYVPWTGTSKGIKAKSISPRSINFNNPALARSRFYTVPGKTATHRAVGMFPKGRGSGWYIDYEDQIHPTCVAVELAFDEYIEALSAMVAPKAAAEIAKIYEEGGRPKWVSNTPSWRKFKTEHGHDSRTMHMTGKLEGRIAELSTHLKSWYDKNTGMFMMQGLDEGFSGADYVWIHEFIGIPRGTNRGVQDMVRRPFIMLGLMMAIQGLAGADDVMQEALSKAPHSVKNIDVNLVPAIVPVESQYAWHTLRLHTTLISLLWWLIPPSKLLMLFGATMDAASLASGKLLQGRYLSLWVTAYVKGQVAARAGVFATEKQARRKARRYVWRGG